jgi:hypothetical protein
MILLVAPATSPFYPAAYNADQLLFISAVGSGSTWYYMLNFVPGVLAYASTASFATEALAVAAAVTLLQSLPVLTILSTLNLVESITLT